MSSGFRHLVLGLPQPIADRGFTCNLQSISGRELTCNLQPIADTGLTWNLQAIVAGKNRFGVSQGDRLVASLGWGF